MYGMKFKLVFISNTFEQVFPDKHYQSFSFDNSFAMEK